MRVSNLGLDYLAADLELNPGPCTCNWPRPTRTVLSHRDMAVAGTQSFQWRISAGDRLHWHQQCLQELFIWLCILCAQQWYTVQHRTVPIISRLVLRTIATAQLTATGEEEGSKLKSSSYAYISLTLDKGAVFESRRIHSYGLDQLFRPVHFRSSFESDHRKVHKNNK